MKYPIVAIGGGAAGYFAAIACAESNPKNSVILLERAAQTLAKVRISGGGRCNVTHACFDPAKLVGFYPRGAQALRGPFSRFHPQHTVDWFSSRGVQLKTEDDGRMFPTTDNSQTIIDCLTVEAEKNNISVRLNTWITSITYKGFFEIHLKSGETIPASAVILATGSAPAGWEWVKALGHSVESPVPSLFTFTITDARLHDLAGVSVPDTRITLEGTRFQQSGPTLITHTGLSGPAVLKLSAWAARAFHEKNYKTELRIAWVPNIVPENLLEQLKRYRTFKMQRVTPNQNPFDLPRRLWERLLIAAGIPPEMRWTEVSNEKLLALTQQLTNGKYAMSGKNPFKEEFVTCGGIRLDEVDFRRMESKKCPGLYFAGEILDIDAVTGGFNFQNAWTTGWIAGTSAATAN